MKTDLFRLFLCCGLLLGYGTTHAQDSNETNLPEAPDANSIRVTSYSTQTTSYYRSTVVGFGNDVVIKKGESCPILISIGGNATVDGTVDGAIVVLGGNLKFNGEARNDTLVIGGSADVGPQGHAQGSFTVVGGALSQAKGATFERMPEEIGPEFGPALQSILHWVTHGLLMGRPVVPSMPFVWGIIGAFFALYCLFAILFRNAAGTAVQTLELHPIGSILTGFLVSMLLAIIISILVITFVGLVLLPFVLCGIFFLGVIGKVAVYEFIGSLFSKRLRPPGLWSLVALTLGMAICVGLGMIPIIGLIVWGMVGVLGIGGVTLACFGLLQREVVATHSAFVAAAPTAPPVTSAPGAAAATAATIASPPVINRHPLPFALASFWPRAGAMALDLIVVGGTLALGGILPLFPLALMGYTIGFLVWRGATIGFIIAGLRCVRANGGALTWEYAIARTLASILSLLPLGLGFLWAALDPDKQTWHDKIAGTVVVKIPRVY